MTTESQLTVGLISSGGDEGEQLASLLEQHQVALQYRINPSEISADKIAASDLHIWLLDVEDDDWTDAVDDLLDQSAVPIFFNERGTLANQAHPNYWVRKLIQRLHEMAGPEDSDGASDDQASAPEASATEESVTSGAADSQPTDSQTSGVESLATSPSTTVTSTSNEDADISFVSEEGLVDSELDDLQLDDLQVEDTNQTSSLGQSSLSETPVESEALADNEQLSSALDSLEEQAINLPPDLQSEIVNELESIPEDLASDDFGDLSLDEDLSGDDFSFSIDDDLDETEVDAASNESLDLEATADNSNEGLVLTDDLSLEKDEVQSNDPSPENSFTSEESLSLEDTFTAEETTEPETTENIEESFELDFNENLSLDLDADESSSSLEEKEKTEDSFSNDIGLELESIKEEEQGSTEESFQEQSQQEQFIEPAVEEPKEDITQDDEFSFSLETQEDLTPENSSVDESEPFAETQSLDSNETSETEAAEISAEDALAEEENSFSFDLESKEEQEAVPTGKASFIEDELEENPTVDEISVSEEESDFSFDLEEKDEDKVPSVTGKAEFKIDDIEPEVEEATSEPVTEKTEAEPESEFSFSLDPIEEESEPDWLKEVKEESAANTINEESGELQERPEELESGEASDEPFEQVVEDSVETPEVSEYAEESVEPTINEDEFLSTVDDPPLSLDNDDSVAVDASAENLSLEVPDLKLDSLSAESNADQQSSFDNEEALSGETSDLELPDLEEASFNLESESSLEGDIHLESEHNLEPSIDDDLIAADADVEINSEPESSFELSSEEENNLEIDFNLDESNEPSLATPLELALDEELTGEPNDSAIETELSNEPELSNEDLEDEIAKFEAELDDLEKNDSLFGGDSPAVDEQTGNESQPVVEESSAIDEDSTEPNLELNESNEVFSEEPISEEAAIEVPGESDSAVATDTDFDLGIEADNALDIDDLDIPLLDESATGMDFVALGETEEPPEETENFFNNIWVIGASLGGPAAVKRFLQALPGGLDIAFVIAQHIDENFLPVLAKILDSACDYEVTVAQDTQVIEPGQILLAPIHGRLTFLNSGVAAISNHPWTEPYSPCIDDVMSDVADTFGGYSGSIIFSGMGNDGTVGAEVMKRNQANVWVQQPDTCANSSMPESIIEAGYADYIGTPEQLAQHLVDYMGVPAKVPATDADE